MANTLTNLIPILYQAVDIVSRELVGMIPAVFRNSSAEQAALNQTITYPVSPAQAAQDLIAGVTPPDTGDQNIGSGSLSITKSRFVPVRWNGEQQQAGNNAGWYAQLLRNQFAQAMRTLTNEVEADLCKLYKTFSRANGTPGTTPFGVAGDLSDFTFTRKILEDNGAPQSDLHMVVNTSAGATLGAKQTVLFKVNEAGDGGALLRRGQIGEVDGMEIGKSAQIQATTKGTGAGYVTNGTHAVGATTINVQTGTGTIVAGDVITFAGDTNKYVVATALSGGVLTIAAPGLLVAPAAGTAITVGNSYTGNLAFARTAIHLITRAPAMPTDLNGKPMDMADDVVYITDPITGLVFQVAVYKQFRQVLYTVCLAWGVGNVKPEHTSILIG